MLVDNALLAKSRNDWIVTSGAPVICATILECVQNKNSSTIEICCMSHTIGKLHILHQISYSYEMHLYPILDRCRI